MGTQKNGGEEEKPEEGKDENKENNDENQSSNENVNKEEVENKLKEVKELIEKGNKVRNDKQEMREYLYKKGDGSGELNYYKDKTW